MERQGVDAALGLLRGSDAPQHVAHHDHRRAAEPDRGDVPMDLRERGGPMRLLRQTRVLHHGHRCVARQAVQ